MNINFSKEELLKLLGEYYSHMFHREITIKEDVSVKYIDGMEQINLRLFYEDNTDTMKIIKFITANDICNFLEDYADKNKLIFIYFKYIGNIRHVGYYTDSNEAIFEGISACFEERNKKLIKK